MHIRVLHETISGMGNRFQFKVHRAILAVCDTGLAKRIANNKLTLKPNISIKPALEFFKCIYQKCLPDLEVDFNALNKDELLQ